MKEAIFHLKRDHFGQDSQKRETTLGIMFDPEMVQFCFVLEDVVRAYGIKRKTSTAIPATDGDFTYKLTVEDSPKYGRVATVWTHKEGGVFLLRNGGIEFSSIRCHGGNHSEHTEGCLLVNKVRVVEDGKMAASGSMKDEFAAKVQSYMDQGYDTRLRVTNLAQKS